MRFLFSVSSWSKLCSVSQGTQDYFWPLAAYFFKNAISLKASMSHWLPVWLKNPALHVSVREERCSCGWRWCGASHWGKWMPCIFAILIFFYFCLHLLGSMLESALVKGDSIIHYVKLAWLLEPPEGKLAVYQEPGCWILQINLTCL